MPFLRRATAPALAAALALGLAACEPDLAPAFQPEGVGSIAGRLFFDADEDGLYTPTLGDTLLVGVPIEVRERGTDEVLEQGVTDAQGLFEFEGLPVGTHDVYVVATEETVGDLVVCVNPLQATVYRGEQAFVTPTGRVACIIDIAEAKDLPDDELAVVVGVVTAPPGIYRANNLYLQDETGGIQVFGTTAAVALGDVVEVRGDRDEFRTEIQLGNSPVVRKLGETAVPDPEEVTVGELAAVNDSKDPFVGVLAMVSGVSVGAFTTSTSGADATMTDATGSARLRLDQNAQARLIGLFEEGACYDLTGIVGIFDGATQLKPRYTTDVVEVACP